MDTDLDTLATALYVTTDDLLKAHPEQLPERPVVGIAPQISDAELIVLSLMQAHFGYRSVTRRLRQAHKDFHTMFPYLPGQSGYNKRLKKLAGTIVWLTGRLAALTSVADDDVWIVDSTPVECGRSRETAKRSELASWAEYGYCASPSRTDPAAGPAPDLIAKKGYHGRDFEHRLTQGGIDLPRPARKGKKPKAGARFFKPLRQIIESVHDTLKGQLDLELPGGRTKARVCVRIAQRILALVAAIWHNDTLGLNVRRSLIAYDH